MKIALASDLHLEFQDVELFNTEGAEVLILAGDIMIAEDMHQHHLPPTVTSPYESYKNLGHHQIMSIRFRDFLARVSKEFPHVVYVAGNHEFYDGKFTGSIQTLRDECAKFSNVYFMERDMKEIGDFTFVGATLWTDCNKGDPLTLYHLQGMMNDYRVIKNDDHGYTKLRPAHTMYRHQQTIGYFKNVIDERKDNKIVVVGHHSPSPQSVHEKYKHDPLMNGGYHSDLTEFIQDRPQIKLWVHGHTHEDFDYNIEGTRIVCHPRGYAGYEASAIDYKVKFLDV
jgi:Icc-related predicted phosphoesterase